jgi:NnrS protein/Transposase DDE domain
MATFFGVIILPTAFDPVSWHSHEMVFGFATAAVAGFVFTAVPNWTGRLPLQGKPLLFLVVPWLAGRAAVATSTIIGGCRRCRHSRRARGCRCPRDHRWPELAKCSGRHRTRRSLGRQHVIPHRGTDLRRNDGVGTSRDCRSYRADLPDRWAHHPELHPQLAGEAGAVPPAGELRWFRQDHAGSDAGRDGVLDLRPSVTCDRSGCRRHGGVWKTRIAEPQRKSFSRWYGDTEARDAVYASRNRLRSAVGKAAMRKRAEIVERSFAHTLERGGMRRTWLRGRENVHKRYLIHVAGHNLDLLMRLLIGAGTPKQAATRGQLLLFVVPGDHTVAIALFARDEAGLGILVVTITAIPT